MQNGARCPFRRARSCGLLLVALWATTGSANPRVAASIVPIHSLVASVMTGVAEPMLLIRGLQSPHSYQMRPSDAARIHEAEVIFWVGGALESFLNRPLAALPASTRIVELSALEGLLLLPNRDGGIRASPADPASTRQHEDHDGHRSGWFDAHIWLDIGNAQRIVRAVAAELATVDPEAADTYRRNADQLSERLQRLDQELERTLAPLRTRPFVVLHDAYQYLEQRYGLSNVGAVMISPDRMPSARHVRELRARIRDLGAVCIFREPQFEPALLDAVLENTDVRVAVIDPIGAQLIPGKDAYFDMMTLLADTLAECLARE